MLRSVPDIIEKRLNETTQTNTLPGYLLHLRHLSAYYFARSYVKGKDVLEIGCNMAYGLPVIAPYLSRYVGLDIDTESIIIAKDFHSDDTINFMIGDALELPISPNSVDVILAFQVIEHLQDDWHFLKQIFRALKPGSLLLVSTPNKRLRLLPFQKPWNSEHIREYTERDYQQILQHVFPKTQIWGIFGNEKIQETERKRVKQKPHLAYAKMVNWRLEKVLRDFERKVRMFTAKFINRQPKNILENMIEQPGGFQLKDFYLAESPLREALDFFAVCRK